LNRLIARILAIVASVYWSVPILGGIFSREPFTLEGEILFVLVLAAILGFVVSWRHVKLGATVMILSAVALCVFAYITAGRSKLLAVLVSGVPFLISGVMLLISSIKPQNRRFIS